MTVTATLDRSELDELLRRAPSAPLRSELRLTRRGRLVVVITALIALMVCGLVIAGGSVATDRAGTPEPTQVIVVGPGDTLWDISSALAPDGDVRDMMRHIEDLNALDSAELGAGQRLIVPAG